MSMCVSKEEEERPHVSMIHTLRGFLDPTPLVLVAWYVVAIYVIDGIYEMS